jgi:hypothetical protein
MTPVSDDCEFDALLKEALTRRELESPAPAHVQQVRERLLAHCAPISRERPATSRWARRALAAVVAAGLLVAVIVLRNPQAGAWDEVSAALKGVAWVHTEIEGPDKLKVENWLSTKRSVAAARAGEWVVYDDFRTGIRQEYRPDDAKLYRMSLDGPVAAGFRDAVELLRQMVRGSDQLDSTGTAAEIVRQSKRTVDDGGRRLIEYSLTYRLSGGRDVSSVVRVNPATNLPETATIKTGGGEMTCRFDYPEFGPEDVYALGVPKDVVVVDRVPPADLRRLATGVLDGRRDFDDYYCVLVQSAASQHWSRTSRMYRTWRKGDCWRIEQAFSDQQDDEVLWKQPLPPDETDRKAYWFKRARETRFYPVIVCDGRHIYRFQQEFSDQAQSRITFLTTGARRDYMDYDRSFAMLPLFLPAPELEGHCATLGGMSTKVVERLVPKPDRGPEGTILIEREYSDRRGQPNRQDLDRFWIDPVNGFLVMRYEMVDLDGDPPKVMQFRQIMSFDRSPSGYFYPTELKWDEAGIAHYYVDFDAKFDDAIFSPDALQSVIQE